MVDPYEWLGVPKSQRPPTHYQLLGVRPEADELAVEAAADRQLARLEEERAGPFPASVDRLVAEVVEARDTLIDPDRRRLYDILGPDPDPSEPAPRPPSVVVTSVQPSPARPWWTEAAPADSPLPDASWWKSAPPLERIIPPPLPPPPVPTPAPATVSLSATRRAPVPVPLIAGGLAVVLLLATGGFYLLRKPASPAPSDETVAANDAPAYPGPKPRAAIAGEAVRPPVVQVIPPRTAPGPEPKIASTDDGGPRRYRGHGSAVVGIATGTDGRVYTIGDDKTLRSWAGGESSVLCTFLSPGIGVTTFDGARRVAACDGLIVALLDPLRPAEKKTFESLRGGVRSLAVSADGRTLATGLSDGFLRVWDTDTGKYEEWPAAREAISAVALTADGRVIAAAAGGPVAVWQIVGQKKLFDFIPHKGATTTLQLSPDGNRLGTAGVDGSATVYDLTGRKEVARFAGHAGPATGVCWLPDGKRLATASVDGTARLWSVETGRALRWLHALDGKGNCLAVDAEGKFAHVGTAPGTVWRVPLPGRRPAIDVAAGKPPAEPYPVPSAVAVQLATAELRTDVAPPAERAEAFLALARGENVAPGIRYALFREARRLAGTADDPDLAARAALGLGEWFDVDDLGELAATLAGFGKTAQRAVLAEAALDAVERAELAQRPEMAARFLRVARAVPNLPEGLLRASFAAGTRLDEGATEATRIRSALATLKANPDDPEANLVYGVYLCLARQHWVLGLPRLARCSDGGLRDLARADLRSPADPAGQLRVGDGWADRAAAAGDSRSRRALLGRARTWFDRVIEAKPDGPDATKARARLAAVAALDLSPADPTVPPPLTPVVTRRGYNSLSAEVRATEWTTEGDSPASPDGVTLGTGDAALRSRFDLMPGSRLVFALVPDGRDLRVVCAGQDVTLPASGRTVRLTLVYTGEELHLTTAGEAGGPVVRTTPIPPSNRGPAPVVLRLTGTADAPGGTRVSSAVVRGPVRPAVPQPE